MVAQNVKMVSGLVEDADPNGKWIRIGSESYGLSKTSKVRDLPLKGSIAVVGYKDWVAPDTNKVLHFIDEWNYSHTQADNLREAPVSPNAPPTAIPSPSPSDKRDIRIMRESCLNAAVATFAAWYPSKDTPVSDEVTERYILGLAERYVAWVEYGGHGEPKANDWMFREAGVPDRETT